MVAVIVPKQRDQGLEEDIRAQVKLAKQQARAGIRSLDEGLYVSAALTFSNALGLTREIALMQRAMERGAPGRGE